MNKKYMICMVAAASVMMLTTSSCKEKKAEPIADTTTEKTVEAVEEKAAPDTLAAETKQEAKTNDSYHLTYEEPKGKVLQVLKDYNAHMADFNSTGVEALGMGFQENHVLVNYTVTDISFEMNNKAKLKVQARKLIESMPINEKMAWRCIPEEGHDLLVTLVGRQSSKIVTMVFTKDELKEILY